jgi:hypothetical protein
MLQYYDLTHAQIYVSTQASTDTPQFAQQSHSQSLVQVKFAQVGIKYTYGQIYMYMQGSHLKSK